MKVVAASFAFSLVVGFAVAQTKPFQQQTTKDSLLYSQWYQHLHSNPELSTMEAATAAYLKKTVAAWGYQITDSLGYHSFAAVLKNGNGPVIYYRTDMDGLPLKEQTGLSFASNATMMRANESLPVMHACGHDIHMSVWLGIAKLMAEQRNTWKGTLVLLAQSAEETGQGAKRMVTTANFQQLPKPSKLLAVHDHASLPAGTVGFCNGYMMAAVDMMNITIYGKGGHGAVPDQAIDPVLLAAQYVTAIQSIVSRNLSSNDPAVITVGGIQGGSAGNIIPDKVLLRLTIRSYSETSRELIFKRLKTIGDNLAIAAGLPNDKLPTYDLLDMSIPSVYNTPAFGDQLRSVVTKRNGAAAVQNVLPVMIGEDFGVYGRYFKDTPAFLLWLGTAAQNSNAAALPSLHSPFFAPAYKETIPGAVQVIAGCLIELFANTK
ncbi:amidohydrolase [Lacibacter luteus]|uniref:Amidohydrolase n=1 Tax=Lacibacter luteus TaxID=2508719 RepID=A0A4Q1CFW6_9BACT|nr:amidohydrolase [Lacibacter luteus]RXK58869.1 amidohydrolase [Lacibacter luteus]